MKRRHRRALFNLFAFSLLGLAVYLNLYRMHDGDSAPKYNSSKSIVKTNSGTADAKIGAKQAHQN